MLRRLKRNLQHWAKRYVYGEWFKRYTHPNPAAEPGPRLRIAVCYLIPLLGDVVMLFPLLDALRREQPEAEIVAFVAGQGRILRMHPGVDQVYERPRRRRSSRYLWPIADIASLWWWWRRELRELRFDLCVMPRGGHDPSYSAHLAWLLGGRRRVGYSSAVEPEGASSDLHASPLLTDEITEIRGIHEIERGSDVLQLAGLVPGAIDMNQASPSLLAIARRSEAQQFVRSLPGLAEPYFILSPGASLAFREWPEENYAAVAQAVGERGWMPVIVGGPEVRAKGDRIAAQVRVPLLNLAGQTDFAQLAALCAGARCFFGNDSGTGHVAGTLGTPVIILSPYALSNPASHQISPRRTHPAGPWHAVMQPAYPLAPCVGACSASVPHCIAQIDVPSVLAAFEDLLARVVRQADAEVASVHSD
jgi:ADP-heptose:LPS heptosyltransferase